MFFNPRRLRIDFDIKDIRYISGLKILIKNSRSKEAGKAIFSGFFAANVFGVFSAKIKMTNVKTKEAMITDPSPQSFRARSVAILAASILTKLLPRRIPPIK
jgi:hypothetical protein